MKLATVIISAALSVGAAHTAFAQGDAEKGAKTFKKCKSCHMIANGDEVIVKGGRVGPNLYGVIGHQAGTAEGFGYSDSLVAAGEAGLVWDEEQLATWLHNPKDFIKEITGDDGAKTKMGFKLKKGGEDVAAYLASVAPAPAADAASN